MRLFEGMRKSDDNGAQRELSVRQSEILMAAVIIARSTSFVFSKLSMGTMQPFNILAVRFIISFIILIALFFKQLKRITPRVLRNGIILGATYTVVMGFEMMGIRETDTSLAALISNSAFILVPIFEIALLRVFPKRRVVVGMAIAFNFAPGAQFNMGCVYLLISMVFYSAAIFETSIFAKEGEPLLVGIIQLGTMGVLSLIASLIFEDFRLPESGSEWGMILLLAVVCSVFGFTLQPVAQRNLDADRAGMFSALNPLAAIFWGFLILGERLTPVKIIGSILILAGIILPSLDLRKNKQ